MSGRPVRRLDHAVEQAHDERVGDVALEPGAAAVVGSGPRCLRGQIGGLADLRCGQRPTDENLRGLRRVDRRTTDASEADARPYDRAAGCLQRQRDPGGGEIADPAFELQVTARRLALRCWYHGLDRDLVD